MISFADIEARLDACPSDPDELLSLGEAVLEHWLDARGEMPTRESHEGFRLLALHRQGARGEGGPHIVFGIVPHREVCVQVRVFYTCTCPSQQQLQ